jgi:hypothetical protein
MRMLRVFLALALAWALLSAGTVINPFWFVPPATVVFTDSSVNTGAATTYTYNTQAFGTAAADRKIVVTSCSFDDATSFSAPSATIGGVAATKLVESATTGQPYYCSAWIANVPTGTTGTVAVTHSESIAFSNGIGVWAVYGAQSSTPVDTDPDNTQTAGASVDLNVVPGGVAIATRNATNFGAGTFAWTGSPTLTGFEDFDIDVETNSHDMSGGSAEFASTITPQTITSTYSVTPDEASMVGVSLR